jgi:L-seryl-tRNA(Ser) seleniumtransferase
MAAKARATEKARAAAKARATEKPKSDQRRRVPSIDALLRSVPGKKATEKFGRPVVKHALQATLSDLRGHAAAGASVPTDDVVMARALGAAALAYYGLSEVINATGVLLHTGLGRAPLPARAAQAAAEAAHGYSDLEVERETGARGRRTARAESLLESLTGAEASLVVNNNAAALLLALAALANRKEVLVSRGELIEIGGEFRLPDIMGASGAKLVEVGTTNRTRAADYRSALSPKTGLILKVHPSNYRVVGFTSQVELSELSEVARRSAVPLLFDLGSGLLDRYPDVPNDEPAVTESLAGGADLVTFSGDKLLGGPQAGLIAGRADLVERLRKHPIARALRVDKMTVAALEAVLRMYATGRREEVPIWRLLGAKKSGLIARARGFSAVLKTAEVRESQAVMGGGSMPGYAIPSAELVLSTRNPNGLAARLRQGRPPVFCRIEDGSLVFDFRTVPPEDDDRLLRAIRYALEQD